MVTLAVRSPTVWSLSKGKGRPLSDFWEFSLGHVLYCVSAALASIVLSVSEMLSRCGGSFVMPGDRRLRQKDCLKFEVSLDYIVSG